MKTRTTLSLLCATAAMTWSDSNIVSAAPITTQIASLTGTVDPITYTDLTGTFTTSPIAVTLSGSSPSFFTVDLSAGTASDHTVMDVSFNNGKPGPLNANLLGVLTVNESGPLQPAPPPLDFTADLTIQNAVLSGAGPFNGTTLAGKNPTFKDFFIEWKFGGGNVTANLPSTFIGGNNIPISGDITASIVPEPNGLVLLAIGATSVLGYASQRYRRKIV